MKAIITSNQSVAHNIARIVRATTRKEGYITGNGYMVTWTAGHLISLVMPEKYGYKRQTVSELPIITEPFQLTVKQVKADKGYKPDIAALKQLKVIDNVLNQSDSIIVATDPSGEGELMFRNIYHFLGYTKPFERLWITSLTDSSIRKGLAELKNGEEYDTLYHSALCREKADWLIGTNVGNTVTSTAGVGRLEIPVLAMICARFKESRDFISAEYCKMHITVGNVNDYRRFFYAKSIRNVAQGEHLYQHLKECTNNVTITKVHRKRIYQSPPLLYDLTALQIDCNKLFGFSAENTREVALSLYNKKLITYPITGTGYITEEMMQDIAELLRKIIRLPEFFKCNNVLDFDNIPESCVDDSKTIYAHAIITTGLKPVALTDSEHKVYTMIAGRMLEAFSPVCKKELLTMEATMNGFLFRSQSERVLSPGWYSILHRTSRQNANTDNNGIAVFKKNDTAEISGWGLVKGKTSPSPLYNEAILLEAIASSGTPSLDPQNDKTTFDYGMFTPLTTADAITTLLNNGDIERDGNNLKPTAKGILIYDAVKKIDIADFKMFADMERHLYKVKCGLISPQRFMQTVGMYIQDITTEIKSVRYK